MHGVILSNGRTMHLPVLNFKRLLSAHFTSLLRLNDSTAMGVSATPPSFLSSADLLRRCSLSLHPSH